MDSKSPDIEQHLAAFATAFVTPSRKERWLEMLSRRTKKNARNSSKLNEALDPRYCHKVDGIPNVTWPGLGVFYDFYDEPIIITMKDALATGANQDAIYSIEPGQLALFFFQEGWCWLCRR
jgi:hypothetical protein